VFGGKLPYFWVESGWRRGGFSEARHFGIAPILGLSQNVPRGTFPALGWFPKVFHVEHSWALQILCRLIVGHLRLPFDYAPLECVGEFFHELGGCRLQFGLVLMGILVSMACSSRRSSAHPGSTAASNWGDRRLRSISGSLEGSF
jgi:hypothetical protein